MCYEGFSDVGVDHSRDAFDATTTSKTSTPQIRQATTLASGKNYLISPLASEDVRNID